LSAATPLPSATASVGPGPASPVPAAAAPRAAAAARPAALLLAAALLLGPACPPRPAAAADALAAPDTAAAEAVAAPRLTPRQALIRSAVLPGWGQVAGGHPVKGALFAATAAGCLAAAVAEWRLIDDAAGDAEREWRAGRRNTRLLWFFATATTAALDAYVDAHLADFGDGAELTVGTGAAPGAGLTLGCALRF